MSHNVTRTKLNGSEEMVTVSHVLWCHASRRSGHVCTHKHTLLSISQALEKRIASLEAIIAALRRTLEDNTGSTLERNRSVIV